MLYSEAEIAALDEEEPAKVAPLRKPSRRKYLLAAGGVVVLATVAFLYSKPAVKRERMWYEAQPDRAEYSQGGGSVPVGVGQLAQRDTGTVLNAKVLTDSPTDAMNRLAAMAATVKPRGGQRYTVELTVTAQP
jgi:hypothetical protein